MDEKEKIINFDKIDLNKETKIIFELVKEIDLNKFLNENIKDKTWYTDKLLGIYSILCEFASETKSKDLKTKFFTQLSKLELGKDLVESAIILSMNSQYIKK